MLFPVPLPHVFFFLPPVTGPPPLVCVYVWRWAPLRPQALAQRREWREAFKLMDEDLDGTITTVALGMVLRALGRSLTQAELRDLVNQVRRASQPAAAACDSGPATDIGVFMGKCLVPRYDTAGVRAGPGRGGSGPGPGAEECSREKEKKWPRWRGGGGGGQT